MLTEPTSGDDDGDRNLVLTKVRLSIAGWVEVRRAHGACGVVDDDAVGPANGLQRTGSGGVSQDVSASGFVMSEVKSSDVGSWCKASSRIDCLSLRAHACDGRCWSSRARTAAEAAAAAATVQSSVFGLCRRHDEPQTSQAVPSATTTI
jgi:hypothetical protein